MGGYHGVLLVIERYFSGFVLLPSNRMIHFLKVFMVFGFVTLGWLLFKLPNFDEVIKYILAIGNNFNYPHNKGVILLIIVYSIPIFGYYLYYLVDIKHKKYLNNFYIYGILLFSIILNSGGSGEFIYFQF